MVREQSAFFDIRVLHPNTPSYRQTQVGSLFRRHELEKKREYGDRVCNVESTSFTPLVFSTFGSLGREASIFYSCLADLIAVRHAIQYSHISCKNTFGVKKVWPSKVESYLEVNT